jgi:hypothetical protein
MSPGATREAVELVAFRVAEEPAEQGGSCGEGSPRASRKRWLSRAAKLLRRVPEIPRELDSR